MDPLTAFVVIVVSVIIGLTVSIAVAAYFEYLKETRIHDFEN